MAAQIRIRRPGPQRLRLVCKKPPIRRLRVIGRVSGADLISFNCKMSRGLRRAVRQAAGNMGVRYPRCRRRRAGRVSVRSRAEYSSL
jgi:hypothetical protein